MKDIQIKHQGEKGQSLIAVLIAAIVLAFFAAALVKYVTYDQEDRVRAKVKTGSLAVADAALQRAVNFLNTGNNWYERQYSPAGFDGIDDTDTAHTEIPGYTYYVDIRPGALSNTSNPKRPTSIDTWVNEGDFVFDRTVVVRVVESKTGRVTKLSTVIRRPDKVPVLPPLLGMAFGGVLSFPNNYHGDSWDSCSGPYIPTPACFFTCSCIGVAQASNIDGSTPGEFCNTTDTTNPPELPSISVHSSAIDVGPIINDIVLGPSSPHGASKYYKTKYVNLGGSIYVDDTDGPVYLWVYGSDGGQDIQVDLGGGANVLTNTPGNWNEDDGGHPTNFYMIVVFEAGRTPDNCNASVGSSVVLGGNQKFQGVLYAPENKISISGSTDFYGAMAGKCVVKGGGGGGSGVGFHYDECLNSGSAGINRYGNPPIITGSWQSVP